MSKISIDVDLVTLLKSTLADEKSRKDLFKAMKKVALPWTKDFGSPPNWYRKSFTGSVIAKIDVHHPAVEMEGGRKAIYTLSACNGLCESRIAGTLQKRGLIYKFTEAEIDKAKSDIDSWLKKEGIELL